MTVEGDGGGGDSRGRAGLGHRLVAVWARVRAAFGDGYAYALTYALTHRRPTLTLTLTC
jgi:hypothetical protein